MRSNFPKRYSFVVAVAAVAESACFAAVDGHGGSVYRLPDRYLIRFNHPCTVLACCKRIGTCQTVLPVNFRDFKDVAVKIYSAPTPPSLSSHLPFSDEASAIAYLSRLNTRFSNF